MEELTAVLGRERMQLEYLLFKVLELQHLLRSGDRRFLRWATDEIERAAERVHATEAIRKSLVGQVAERHGLCPDSTSLGSLADSAPEPWRTILEDHNSGFGQLTYEVSSVLRVTRALAEASGHAVAELLKDVYRPSTLVIALPRDA